MPRLQTSDFIPKRFADRCEDRKIWYVLQVLVVQLYLIAKIIGTCSPASYAPSMLLDFETPFLQVCN